MSLGGRSLWDVTGGYGGDYHERAAISRGRKGMSFTPEHCANIRKARLGKPAHNKGIPCSDAQKNNLKRIYAGRARTLYGRGGLPSPTMLEYAQIFQPLGYIMDSVTIPIPTGSVYKLDFALLEAKVDVEIDGYSHLARIDQDARRDTYLRGLGWHVIRIKA
jgi:hypothetical protein